MSTSTRHLDLAILGGGVVGSSLAWHASSRFPDIEIGLFEQSMFGGGATRRAGAICGPIGHTELHRQYVTEGVSFWRKMRPRLPANTFFDLPIFWVVPPEKTAPFSTAVESGDIRLADGTDLDTLFQAYPDLVIKRHETVYINDRPSFYADSELAVRSLTALLRQEGRAYCVDGVEGHLSDSPPSRFVDDHRQRGNSPLKLTLSTGELVTTRAAVFAQGPWLVTNYALPRPLRAGLRTKKITALHIDHVPNSSDPAVSFADEGILILPRFHEGIYLCNFPNKNWDCPPDSTAFHISESEQAAGVQWLAKRSLKLAEGCNGGRSFCDSYTHNLTPVIRADRERRGLGLVGGCSGSGFRHGPGLSAHALKTLEDILR